MKIENNSNRANVVRQKTNTKWIIEFVTDNIRFGDSEILYGRYSRRYS